MFNFTTTNVINSLADSSGNSRWTVDNDTLHVLRVGKFKKDNISAVYMANPEDAVLESVTIPADNLFETGKQYRLNMYIGLTQASQDSRYSNDMMYKGKPFTVEFVGKDDDLATFKALKKTIDRYQMLVYGEKQLDTYINMGGLAEGQEDVQTSPAHDYQSIEPNTAESVEADEPGFVITAMTEFQRFKKLVIEEYDETNKSAYPYEGTYTTIWDLEDNKEDCLTPGKEGFGTYSYIMSNLRIPTFENTHPFSVMQDEAPIVGAKYAQITLHYCVQRGPLGMNAVGHSVTSTTTHVFYVREDLVENFVNAFTAMGITFSGTSNVNEGVIA